MAANRTASLALPSAIITIFLLVLGTRDAASQPTVRFPAEQPVPVSARVALLEQRIHRLEQRLAAFERASAASTTPPRPDCEPPFHYDAQGIKRYKPECLSVAPDCEPPYNVDVSGIKRYKPECL
jgi:hypothetical protein